MADGDFSRFASGVYEVVNTTNGKRYVGSAIKLASRWNGHQCRLGKGRHHSKHLQSSWDKHGRQAFEFRILLLCARDNLLMYEQILIDAMSPEFNVLKIAGSSLGATCAPETRAKIAAKALGRKRSAESVERGAAKLRGVPLPPERISHLIGNKFSLGTKFTDERRAQISLQMTGIKRPKDAQYRAKIAASLKGRIATPEHRANQSAAQKGKKRGSYKPWSTEARARFAAYIANTRAQP